MDRAKYLAKNTFIFALGNLGTKLISFFLIPLYTSVLTSGEYGTADLIFTIGTFTIPIIILNIYESVMRFCLDKDANYNKVMSVGVSIIATSFLSGIVLALISRLYEPTSDYYIYVYLYAISSGITQVFLCYLRGREYLVKYSIGNILQAFLIVCFSVIFILLLRQGIKGCLLAYIFANFSTGLYAFIAGDILQVIKNFSIDKNLCIAMIKYSVILIPNSFMWWIMNSADRLMITSIVGVAATGIYAVANKIPALISVISTVFNQAYSYSAIKEEESQDKEEFSNNIFDYLLSIVIVASILLIILIKPFMKLYVGFEFYEAWIYTPPLIVGSGILVLATFLSTSYTVYKDSKGFLFSATVGAVINILLNIFLIPILGIMGAAVATAFSYFVVLVYRYFDTKKYVKIKVFTVKHTISLTSLLLTCVLIYSRLFIVYIIIFLFLVLNLVLYKNNWKKFFYIFMGLTKRLK